MNNAPYSVDELGTSVRHVGEHTRAVGGDFVVERFHRASVRRNTYRVQTGAPRPSGIYFARRVGRMAPS